MQRVAADAVAAAGLLLELPTELQLVKTNLRGGRRLEAKLGVVELAVAVWSVTTSREDHASGCFRRWETTILPAVAVGWCRYRCYFLRVIRRIVRRTMIVGIRYIDVRVGEVLVATRGCVCVLADVSLIQCALDRAIKTLVTAISRAVRVVYLKLVERGVGEIVCPRREKLQVTVGIDVCVFRREDGKGRHAVAFTGHETGSNAHADVLHHVEVQVTVQRETVVVSIALRLVYRESRLRKVIRAQDHVRLD